MQKKKKKKLIIYFFITLFFSVCKIKLQQKNAKTNRVK